MNNIPIQRKSLLFVLISLGCVIVALGIYSLNTLIGNHSNESASTESARESAEERRLVSEEKSDSDNLIQESGRHERTVNRGSASDRNTGSRIETTGLIADSESSLLTSGSLSSIHGNSLSMATAYGSRMHAEEEKEASPTPSPNEVSLWGAVKDPTGKSLENVRVLVRYTGESGLKQTEDTTDVTGEYLIPGITARTLEIQAIPSLDSPFAPSENRVKHLLESEDHLEEDFVLTEGDIIEGLVVDEDEEPIGGATVEALTIFGIKKIFTDGEGSFRVSGIPQGKAIETLTVSHPEYQPEQRTRISMFDGLQKFILKQTNLVTLRVEWSFDNTPVEFYTYRILKKLSYSDLFVNLGNEEVVVENPDGMATLGTLGSGTWQVDVTVLTPEKTQTDIRGSAQFELTTGQQGKLVVVSIDTGRRVKGRVVLNEQDGVPVEGAEIKFLPPSAGFGRYIMPGEPFKISPVITDASGSFEFEGIPPGHFTLSCQKENLCAPGAIDLVVPYEDDPQPLEIIMLEGGTISGTIIGVSGSYLEGAKIVLSEQRLDADGWNNREVTTNENGYYEFTGLHAGVHYVWAYAEDGKHDSQSVNLGPGEDIELNFNFSENIHLSGTILFNSEPAPAGLMYHFVAEGQAMSNWSSIGPNGTYESLVSPGKSIVRFSTGAPGGQTPSFVIPDSPNIQNRDLDFPVVNVDVVIEFPSEEQFEPGTLVLLPEESVLRYGFYRVNMHQSNRHVVSLFGGKYQGTFRSKNGEWHGQTEWVTLDPDLTNTIVIEVKKTTGLVRIGGWSPGQLSMTDYTPLSFDITPLLESAGSIQILVNYETGRHAVEIGGVSLLENGVLVSEDGHRGWSGADHWNNQYNLRLNELHRGLQYILEVRLRSDGGTDSTGSVFFSLNQDLIIPE